MADTEIKVFGKWSAKDIIVQDDGVRDYITLEPKVVMRSAGRYAHSRFHKSKVFIVERLVHKLMNSGHKAKKHFKSSGHMTGKVQTAQGIVEKAFRIIEQRTKKNPVEVFVKGLENAAPREEIITIEYGGARYPKAVECAPQRRIDLALRIMTQGSHHKAFNSKKSIHETLAEEIMNAYNMSPNSSAISKKLELERQADSSR
ncbi:30S ribosomal protein S7 [Candidatus Woesearchaeota archaeon CG10_big_fil_rev_8_21_14_0_10_44_13]|nr:MAG: 30S ribosomal protein S7 [Candidatus Woesearchaeota archaeon CG10_big_fil_rev_8_21_14_0_10_44_13]